MKNFKVILIFLLLTNYATPNVSNAGHYFRFNKYFKEDLKVKTVKIGGVLHNILSVKSDDQNIKVKCFTSKGISQSIENRYLKFSNSHKNILFYTSCQYMIDVGTGNKAPLGLTIDQGEPINRNLERNGFDALVINGGENKLRVYSLISGTITIEGNNFNLKEASGKGKASFLLWAKKLNVTVFQTHLLAENDKLLIYKYGCTNCEPRERRFLLESKNIKSGVVSQHLIQRQTNSPVTLYQGSKDVLEYFKSIGEVVNWMINLDTGKQNAFACFDSKGLLNPEVFNEPKIVNAGSLLLYYLE